MKTIGIYSRLLLMLILTGLIFLFLLSTLYIIKDKQEKLMADESLTQFGNEVNSLLILKTATLKQVAYDYTFWNDFVEKINNIDTAWYNNNITTILKSFHFDYVCVYDTSFNIVHEASSGDFFSRRFISNEVISKLKETRFLNFFLITSDGVTEISGASVHPDTDPSHTLTKPSGYLFLAKNWNKGFLQELSNLSGAKANLLTLSDSIAHSDPYSISIAQKLPGWNGENVSQIVFIKSSIFLKLYHRMSVYMILIMFGSILTTLLLFHFTSRKWINKPLKLVTNILKTEDPDQIKELQQCQGEFRDIGILFHEFINQQDELKVAKEKAEESDELKTAFLNNISHEIRTPFNGLLGFLNIMQKGGLSDSDRNEYIGILNNSANRLMNTINDIVEISQIQAGQIKLAVAETNISNLMIELFDRYQADAENKGLNFILKNTLTDANCIIKTDRSKIYTILFNLINNAIKYCENGTIEFGYNSGRAGTTFEPVETVELEFFVKDTGIGIPKDRLEAIFERFVQADIKDTRAFQGAGLGLSIAKAYVEMLGGKIWVESQEGKGSTFRFTIPYNVKPQEINIIKPVFSREGKEVQLANLKILIAEDDETSDLLITRTLNKISREVLHTKNGVETVEYCRKNPDINVVLMDIRMPEMDGYAATRQIRQFNKDVVIIAQTAYGLTGDREKALKAGCNDYIVKPLSIALLKELIQKHFYE